MFVSGFNKKTTGEALVACVGILSVVVKGREILGDVVRNSCSGGVRLFYSCSVDLSGSCYSQLETFDICRSFERYWYFFR